MIFKPDEVEINDYYRRLFTQAELVGFLDVTRIVTAWNEYEADPNAKYRYEYSMTPDERKVIDNSFGHLSVECKVVSTGETKHVMPVFFFNSDNFSHWGPDGFKFDTETDLSRTFDFSKKFILFYKGNDDWSLGQRFATAEERQEFLDLFDDEAGSEPLEGWN